MTSFNSRDLMPRAVVVALVDTQRQMSISVLFSSFSCSCQDNLALRVCAPPHLKNPGSATVDTRTSLDLFVPTC